MKIERPGFKNYPKRPIPGSHDYRIAHQGLRAIFKSKSPAIMNNEKITGSSQINRQNSTLSSSNFKVTSRPEFVRPMPATQTSNILPPHVSSTAPQTASKMVRTPERPGWYASGKVNISDQLRLAITNKGPNYTYDMYRYKPLEHLGEVPPRRLANLIKGEFAFGMLPEDRGNLFETMTRDVLSNGDNIKMYAPDVFINPDAVKAMRQQAVAWNQIPGNNISTVPSNDTAIREFFRELALNIPAEHRQAALAMIDQPPEYRQPLPGTRSERIATSQSLPGNIAASASNQTMPNTQAPQGGYAPHAGASSYPATLSAPSMVNKRSFASANNVPTFFDDSSQTFKRSRLDDANQAFPSNPNAAGQPTAQYQPQQMPQATNSWTPTYQDDIFLGGPPFDPPQSQQSSSWSASNGMSRPTSLQQAQPQIESQMQPPHNPGITNDQTNVFLGGQFFDPSQLQPPLQPQMQPAYNSGAIVYQPHLFQGGASIDHAQSQPSSSWSASNGTTQPEMQTQLQTQLQPQQQMQPPQMQPAYNQWASNYSHNVVQGGQYFDHSLYQPTLHMHFQTPQFDQGGVFQASHTNGPSFIGGQPAYGVANAAASPGPVGTDADWNQLINMIDFLAPTMPATTVTGQTTSAPINSLPTNQPGTRG